LPPPPPPVPPPTCASASDLAPGWSPGKCPVCLSDPVAMSASCSGHVGCYTCLVDFVNEYGACPVTGTPCTKSQVRRLCL
jgi:hypothetical protein